MEGTPYVAVENFVIGLGVSEEGKNSEAENSIFLKNDQKLEL